MPDFIYQAEAGHCVQPNAILRVNKRGFLIFKSSTVTRTDESVPPARIMWTILTDSSVRVTADAAM